MAPGLGLVAFFAVNLFLWTQPLTPIQLFMISVLADVVGLAGLFWLAAHRHRDGTPE
jgi:hypothetical protein